MPLSSSWPLISAHEALLRIQQGAAAVDVRSHGEFTQGDIPSSVNIPILNDEQRHQVGLCYKQEGQVAAIELGHRLVETTKAYTIEAWRRALQPLETRHRLLFCWRGGLRSQIASEWLSNIGLGGFRVEGGYKAMRREFLGAIHSPREFLVLGGMTGVGKSELLGALSDDHALDLETLSQHRGSAFGRYLDQPQPTQQTFENRLGFAFFKKLAHPLVVESESRLIGRCQIPRDLYVMMLNSPLVILEDSLENRSRRIFAEYVAAPLKSMSTDTVCNEMQLALKRIERRLGGLRTKKIAEQIGNAFSESPASFANHRQWIESLLTEYYDPAYEHSLKGWNGSVIFSGHADAVKNFFATRLGGRRT